MASVRHFISSDFFSFLFSSSKKQYRVWNLISSHYIKQAATINLSLPSQRPEHQLLMFSVVLYIPSFIYN